MARTTPRSAGCSSTRWRGRRARWVATGTSKTCSASWRYTGVETGPPSSDASMPPSVEFPPARSTKRLTRERLPRNGQREAPRRLVARRAPPRSLSPQHCADLREVVVAVPQRVILDEELAGERRVGVERYRGRPVELRVVERPHHGGRGLAV